MARMTALDPPFPDDAQASFDRIMPPGVPPLVLFRTLARSDRAWRRFRAGSLLADSPLTLRQRELVILRVCARSACEYEWGVHVSVFSEAAGLTRDQVRATLGVPLDTADWTDDEVALLITVDALHDRVTLTDGKFASLAEHFDEDQILEVLMLCGFYRTVAYIANGLDLAREPGAATFV